MSGVHSQIASNAADSQEQKVKPLEVYFCANDQHERKVAEAWIKAKKPSSKLMSFLHLQRLGAHLVIIPLIRGEDRSALESTERQPNGMSAVKRIPAADLIDEIRVCKAVKVADHWQGTIDEYGGLSGELDRPSFHQALAASVSPMRPECHTGMPDIMKLEFL